jgi:hypothetical protein
VSGIEPPTPKETDERTSFAPRGPRPLSERPARPSTATMLAHLAEDGRITHFEFSGENLCIERQIDTAVALLLTTTPRNPTTSLGYMTNQALAALAMQLAALIDWQRTSGNGVGTHRTNKTRISTVLRATLTYLQKERQASINRALRDEESANRELIPEYAYFEFGWEDFFTALDI